MTENNKPGTKYPPLLHRITIYRLIYSPSSLITATVITNLLKEQKKMQLALHWNKENIADSIKLLLVAPFQSTLPCHLDPLSIHILVTSKKKRHPQIVWLWWVGPTPSGQTSVWLDWRKSADYQNSGKLREQSLSQAGCCDAADFHMLDSFACLLLWPAKPLSGCYSVSSQQIFCQSCQRKIKQMRPSMCKA